MAMAARGMPDTQAAHARPEVGDILVVIHDFQARSSDELSLAKGDRVELIERDDEFGDGWFLGKHMVNGNSGLFPEVYTRPPPKGAPVSSPNANNVNTSAASKPMPALPVEPPKPEPNQTLQVATKEMEETQQPSTNAPAPMSPVASVTVATPISEPKPSPAIVSPKPISTPMTLPLSSFKSPTSSSPAIPRYTNKSLPPLGSAIAGSGISRLNSTPDSYVLHETLNVIDEHITETLRSTPSNGHQNGNDSGSEYSSQMDPRMSYIQGEETDEEEEGMHTRSEVEAWSADEVAEYLFTAGVEKQHCEVFRDQEISGEVLLGMDQTSIFIKAFDLGSVGRRLKTWQKVKALQDEVNGQGLSTRRTTQTYGSDVGSDDARRGSRSRTNTLTSTGGAGTSGSKLALFDGNGNSTVGNRRRSVTQTPKLEPVSPVSPVSPGSPSRPNHEKRPSAASVRELHHSRRHSSTDFRLTGTAIHTPSATPKLPTSGTGPQAETGKTASHKKQPSFDRNWTLGSAITSPVSTAYSTAYTPRPISSAGFPQQDMLGATNPSLQDSAVDLDRGYFSSTDADGRKRNVLKKRDSLQTHSRQNSRNTTSYTEEQRVRSATALSKHSRFGSVDSTRDSTTSPAAQKYYGLSSTVGSTPHRRTASTNTTDSMRPVLPLKDSPNPTVTKLDGATRENARSSPISPISPINRQAMHVDWLSKPGFKNSSFSLRAISDAVTGQERAKASPLTDSPLKDSPVQSPTRTGSSTPSAGPSFELDSPNSKSPSTAATTQSARSGKKKSKKETSAYLRGLQKISPRQAIAEADYSGWMKKKSSNLMTTWKPRLFVLKGRRLAYYYSEDDEQEKGLIDISFHRVLPADNERLTGLHATLTGASTTPTIPANANVPTLAATEAERDTTNSSDSIFIFKLMPPRAGLSRAVNFTKPMVHYFAVPNIKQGRLWMAALMKATIDRDDMQPITTTYQQKTISLAKARAMRHRPPALMNLDEKMEGPGLAADGDDETADSLANESGGLGIVFDEKDSGVSGLEKLGLTKVESARNRQFPFDAKDSSMPQSA